MPLKGAKSGNLGSRIATNRYFICLFFLYYLFIYFLFNILLLVTILFILCKYNHFFGFAVIFIVFSRINFSLFIQGAFEDGVVVFDLVGVEEADVFGFFLASEGTTVFVAFEVFDDGGLELVLRAFEGAIGSEDVGLFFGAFGTFCGYGQVDFVGHRLGDLKVGKFEKLAFSAISRTLSLCISRSD